MLRMKPVQSAKRAEEYYAKSDGGYYVGETIFTAAGAAKVRRCWASRAARVRGIQTADSRPRSA